MERVSQVTIIGTGLLGSSVGLGLKAAGWGGTVVGVGRRRETLEQARAVGAIDRIADDLADAVAGSQLAIVAVPLGAFDRIFEQLAPHDHDGLVITDVGSTKQSVLDAAERHLSAPRRFVGSHPMAGSEQQGPEAARADLFHGKPCILTPTADTDGDALRLVESLWTQLGMHLIHMTAHQHDQQTAVISHLPHAAAVLLVQVAGAMGGWEIASTGFRDTTRLASSNPPMRADILTANRAQVIEALRAFRGRLDELCDMLERNDRDALLRLLESSRHLREQWLQRKQP